MLTTEHLLAESPLGMLTLVSADELLSGLYTPDHLLGSKVQPLGSRSFTGFQSCSLRAPRVLRPEAQGLHIFH